VYERDARTSWGSKVGKSALNKGFSNRNGGFKEIYLETNYSYADANGNMTQDNNKGIRLEIARNNNLQNEQLLIPQNYFNDLIGKSIIK
jgi:hypothetical protein